MKNAILPFLTVFFVLQISCSKTPESKVEDQSIESAEGDKVLIRLKPKVGDIQKTMMTVDMSSEGAQAMKMNMKMNLDLKVTDKKADVYTYEIDYKSMKMNMDAGGMQMSYDSENENQSGINAMMHEQMKAVMDNPMTMKMNDKGKVSDFQMPNAAQNQQMGDVGSISIPLPENPVGVGDSWDSERNIPNVGNMKMSMKIDKITVDDVVIGTSGDIINESGTKLGDFNGNYTLRRDNGLTKEGTINLNFSAEGRPVKMKVNFKSL